ncbi:MAG: hypothetical protein HY820_30855, partial [Acidobacteria bacterium]|nr:hypothetical protein [Acidobacteriota bacterium]
QSGPAGAALTRSLVVKVGGVGGLGVPAVTVGLSVVAGSASLSTPTAVTRDFRHCTPPHG